MAISQSTWQALGLSVAASYAGLGLYSVLQPRQAASVFFALPPPKPKDGTTQDGVVVPLLMPLLGARDLSFAATMFALAYGGKWRELGTVILGGMILSATDIFFVWKSKGPRE